MSHCGLFSDLCLFGTKRQIDTDEKDEQDKKDEKGEKDEKDEKKEKDKKAEKDHLTWLNELNRPQIDPSQPPMTAGQGGDRSSQLLIYCSRWFIDL